ncbi:glycine rich domain-containing protein [Bifidobacterium sp.]|uniref:glycine rich domain-containing protein n=1 Tax=Bifidobacterium sp. TaxID=41200 RepID=UPI0039E8FDB7
MVLLAVLLMGFVSSFFSDWLDGGQSSMAGVAELREGGFSLTHFSEGDADGELVFAENKTTNYVKDDGSIDADGVLEDFNPGDSLEVSFDVGNAGAKSVWYRTLLAVTVRMASAEPADVAAFYSPKLCVWQLDEESAGGPGKFTQATAMVSDADVSCRGDVPGMKRVGFEVVPEGDAADDGDPSTVQLRASSLDGVLSADPTAQDAEVEACEAADCPSNVRVRYGVYFNPGPVSVDGVVFDDDEWQGARYGFAYAAEAIQHRNVTAPDWDGTDIEPYHDDYDDSVLRWDYGMTGSAEAFTVPVDGVYQFEAWGAKGYSSGARISVGAYTVGNVFLRKGMEVFVYVGGQSTGNDGGFNGGGFARGGANEPRGGGGATDFRMLGGAWDDVLGLNSRIMVAAGAGGITTYGNSHINAGDGGGLTGLMGSTTANQTWQQDIPDATRSQGGGQTSGGQGHSATANKSGGFGIGGAYISGAVKTGGGGGGWYGGGAGGVVGDSRIVGGAGGSSFISGYPGAVALSDTSAANAGNPRTHRPATDSPSDRATQVIDGREYRFTSYAMKAGNESMPDWSKSDGSQMTGNAGDGHARITLL